MPSTRTMFLVGLITSTRAPIALQGCAGSRDSGATVQTSGVVQTGVEVTHAVACWTCAHTTASGAVVLAIDGGTAVVPDAGAQ